MRLQVENLSYSYGAKEVVHRAFLHVNEGEFVGLIGANGSGKSTILKNIYRALIPSNGNILLDGENLLKISYKKSAQKIAVVGQENDIPFDFTVEEIVSMGRSPYKKLFDIDNEKDKSIVHHALEHMGIENMAKRNYLQLSGGEKQRVIIARAIAQETDFLILDEPTNHLDINYQMQILDFIKRLKVTVLSAIHDLNMAALYCNRIYVLKEGKVVLYGTPEEVLTPNNIFDVYGVRCVVEKNSITDKISITYLPETIK